MNNLNFLWAATSVVWLVTLLYIFTLIRRQGRLQKEIDAVRESLNEATK